MQDSNKRGPGQFQWNRGGWFGGQIGGTLWLILLGCALLSQGHLVGAVALAFGLLSNVLGLLLWRRRRTLSPYPAIQILVGFCGLSGLISLLAISASPTAEQTFQTSQNYWYLLFFPGLMLMFHLQERTARKADVDRQN